MQGDEGWGKCGMSRRRSGECGKRGERGMVERTVRSEGRDEEKSMRCGGGEGKGERGDG